MARKEFIADATRQRKHRALGAPRRRGDSEGPRRFNRCRSVSPASRPRATCPARPCSLKASWQRSRARMCRPSRSAARLLLASFISPVGIREYRPWVRDQERATAVVCVERSTTRMDAIGQTIRTRTPAPSPAGTHAPQPRRKAPTPRRRSSAGQPAPLPARPPHARNAPAAPPAARRSVFTMVPIASESSMSAPEAVDSVNVSSRSSRAPSNRDRDRLAGLARDERQRAGGRRVVRARRGCPLRGRIVHRHLARRRCVPESPRRQARPRSHPPRPPRPTPTARPGRPTQRRNLRCAVAIVRPHLDSYVPPAARPVRPPPARRLYAIQRETVPWNSTTSSDGVQFNPSTDCIRNCVRPTTIVNAIHQDLRGFMQCPRFPHRNAGDSSTTHTPDRHPYAPEPAGAACFGDLPPDRALDRPLGASDARLGFTWTPTALLGQSVIAKLPEQQGSANRLLPRADRTRQHQRRPARPR